ncbi:aspartyl aminopeptidase [Magnaporthiopsis poae ATCC 64411]|uniref:aspartyl aminopeptidase n=1 Tax=Magnaporthiopsis poae (strain ATCC 64411 / 73-15) TaxID=644358 RepID=A0A0C4E244_MAGP6|nr:aspartyl aminopeptidase [Magnaporthiopsis poae ATCC 64411]
MFIETSRAVFRTVTNISLGRLRTAVVAAAPPPRQLARFSSLQHKMTPPKSAYEFLDFVNASPTPYHAVATSASLLEAAGFQLIKERDNWASSLKPGGKYYLTRNGSSIVAFAIGAKTGAKTGEPAPKAGADAGADAGAEGADYQPLKQMTERHHPYIIEIVAEHVGVAPADVVDFELVLFDTQKACLGGINDEFIFSARLDNLNMTFCSVRGLIDSVSSPSSLEAETGVRLISCFDHEEIGSTSSQGANSNLLPTVIRRLCAVPPSSGAEGGGEASTAFEQSLATSFLVSADMAHSVHPNYAAKYESSHAPEMNKGTVIKVNANQRYATNSPGIVLLQESAKVAGVPLQLFVVRNDSPCGSTIGPMLSAKTGIRTLDLGNPQLSMHSIRETGGSHDVEHSIRLFDAFLSNYSRLEAKILVD